MTVSKLIVIQHIVTTNKIINKNIYDILQYANKDSIIKTKQFLWVKVKPLIYIYILQSANKDSIIKMKQFLWVKP